MSQKNPFILGEEEAMEEHEDGKEQEPVSRFGFTITESGKYH